MQLKLNLTVRRAAPYALALGTVFFWGASFPVTKLALNALGPMSIAFLRWTISALALAGWLAARHALPTAGKLARAESATLVWMALTGVTLFYALENLALRYTSVTNAGILANFTSIFMALFGAFWLRERLGLREWGTLTVAFFGAVLISLGAGHVTLNGAGLRGDLMMVVACIFSALYSLGGKRLVARYPADVVTTLVAGLGALFLLPLALWEGFTLALPPAVWLALLVLGLGSGALANLWWLYILAIMKTARAGMILFLVPVSSTVLAVTVLHEPITLSMLAGAALVLGSVAFMERAS